MRPEEVVEEVKARLRPSPEERERVGGVASKALNAAARALADLGLEGEARLGGSYAHGTWLAGHADIDVFVLLQPGVNLEDEGLKVAGRALDIMGAERVERKYAEHPYLSGKVGGIDVEVVPCYRVQRGQWISAADRSPYHTEYLLSRLTDAIRDEIRVAKAFMIAQGVYGAEIKVRGFSGYLVEVLVLKYGGLIELMRAATSWRMGEVLALETLPAGFRPQQQAGALIIVPDPVDPRRNLGAAVSAWSLGRFIASSEAFLEYPRGEFFERQAPLGKPLEPEDVAPNSITLIIEKPLEPEDILWGELWRTVRGMSRYLESRGFNVLAYAAGEDERTIAVSLLLDRLSCCRVELRRGPHIMMAEARRRFLDASGNKGPIWIDEDGRMFSTIIAGERSALDELRAAIRDPVRIIGASKGLEGVLRSARILQGMEALRGDESARKSLGGLAYGRQLA
ncbi:CCA tRNA nucleotidyltransferase [Conexivisphaera calida]|uniref:CCA tRNA nucleotidyltransferase n=1 Tax=Conexivisphaera calida TaxID=1874277 RepID=UPI00157B1E32|nr:CCA tRNA nucleotidyltransferase [Conexivisphaera calida]